TGGSAVYSRLPTEAVVIGPHALLDVSGLWVNDSNRSSGDLQGSAFINGGDNSITTNKARKIMAVDAIVGGDASNRMVIAQDATQSIVLAPGSVLDLSSGGYVAPNGRLRIEANGLPAGKGGSLKLTTYAGDWDPHTEAAVAASDLTVSTGGIIKAG